MSVDRFLSPNIPGFGFRVPTFEFRGFRGFRGFRDSGVQKRDLRPQSGLEFRVYFVGEETQSCRENLLRRNSRKVSCQCIGAKIPVSVHPAYYATRTRSTNPPSGSLSENNHHLY